MACANTNGQITMWREETTNWFGTYAMRFDGAPDLTGCYAQISGSGQGSTGCRAAAGPAQSVRLMFRMFDMEMYAVDSLLSQPAQPMSFCSRSSTPVPTPGTPSRPPSFQLPPVPRMPPMPPLPPLPPAPPVPFLEASACSHEKWTAPEYKCYWKVVNPDMKVASVFGLLAAQKYGTDMTLREGLQGRGDPYRTLLREAITSLLNSYNSLLFPYHTLGVIQHMSLALMGSQQNVLLTALRFKRANSGSGNLTCKFTACK